MSLKPDNVVLTKAAALALKREFIGWQCRIRQLAARESGGRPSSGMRPRVTSREGHEISPGMTLVILETEPANNTQLFRHQYLKTQDPGERYAKVLEILQASYFQQPALFSDVMTALFGAGSAVAERLLSHSHCVLAFEQYSQGYRIPCAVAALDERHPFYQATYWHNHLFNPNLPARVEILSFTPDWTHAADYRLESGA